MGSKHKSLFAPIVLLLALMLTMASLHLFMGFPMFNPSPYNSYLHQAMAWRSGQMHLPQDVPHLELAIYEGQYYVSFPPVPTIPNLLLSYVFGWQVPDGLLVKAYLLLCAILIYLFLKKNGFSETKSALWSFLICTASSALPLFLDGAVWYQAQTLSLLLTIAAIYYMDSNRPSIGLICYALAVGCRPFNVLYGPVLFYCWYKKQPLQEAGGLWNASKPLLAGVFSGLLIAALYAWYNWARFCHVLEFGHNHLPEFSFQGGTQFSLDHLASNARVFMLGLPFYLEQGALTFHLFGFSLFLANPILLLLMFWFISGLSRRQTLFTTLIILFFFALHLLALMMHRTFGGFQYGARYAVDLLPWALLMLGVRRQKNITLPEGGVMFLGFFLAYYGSLMIKLPHM